MNDNSLYDQDFEPVTLMDSIGNNKKNNSFDINRVGSMLSFLDKYEQTPQEISQKGSGLPVRNEFTQSVKNYQKEKGLAQDGALKPNGETITNLNNDVRQKEFFEQENGIFKLHTPLKAGENNDPRDVRAVQNFLKTKGEKLPSFPRYFSTSYLPPEIHQSISRFQASNQLKPDGIIAPGGETENAINREMEARKRALRIQRNQSAEKEIKNLSIYNVSSQKDEPIPKKDQAPVTQKKQTPIPPNITTDFNSSSGRDEAMPKKKRTPFLPTTHIPTGFASERFDKRAPENISIFDGSYVPPTYLSPTKSGKMREGINPLGDFVGGFGARRFASDNSTRAHLGIDLQAKAGETIFSPADGKIDRVDGKAYGNDKKLTIVTVKNRNGEYHDMYYTKVLDKLKVGAKVKKEILSAFYKL